MDTKKIEQLLEKYFEGETSLEEEKMLRNYFATEDIPDHLTSYRDQFRYIKELSQSATSDDFNAFGKINKDENMNSSHHEEMMNSDFSAIKSTSGWNRQLNNKMVWSLRIAAGIILLLVGFSAGLLINLNKGVSNRQVAALQQEINQMKTALVYGGNDQLSASERISAVKLSDRVPENTTALDGEITEILIYTMNNDENINVREAASEALFRFRSEPRIRTALVNSLSNQQDPLMQITLINMLVELKEKSAINEMQKLLMDTDTRDVVKTRLEVGIAELKT
jgi:hypothetical protein